MGVLMNKPNKEAKMVAGTGGIYEELGEIRKRLDALERRSDAVRANQKHYAENFTVIRERLDALEKRYEVGSPEAFCLGVKELADKRKRDIAAIRRAFPIHPTNFHNICVKLYDKGIRAEDLE
jgi:tetrahydromethanopterin S-methyltransferase subunit G